MSIASIAAKQETAVQATGNVVPFATAPSRAPLNRASELWLAIPKGGKTLGGSDDAFLSKAGFIALDRTPRIDDYRLVEGQGLNAQAPETTGLRAFIKRPKDALKDILRGGLDVAVVGRDVLKEVNATLPPAQKLKEIVDLDMASCVLTLSVPETGAAKTLADFNNAAIATKYEDTLARWLNRQGITPAEIVVRDGGMEGMLVQYDDIKAIADIVESGNSLVSYGLKPFGTPDAVWEDVKAGKRFTDLPANILSTIPGVITMSRAVLVRTPQALPAEKESAIQSLAQRFYNTAKTEGRKPTLKMKIPKPVATRTPAGFRGHGAIWL